MFAYKKFCDIILCGFVIVRNFLRLTFVLKQIKSLWCSLEIAYRKWLEKIMKLKNVVEIFPEDKNLVKWDKKFELGIPSIDEQHKTLVELCNKLYISVISNENSWKDSYQKSLKECYDYTQSHFTYEEKLMEKVGYADFESHKKIHVEFMKKVFDAAQQFNEANVSDAISLSKFLFNWILSHIAHDDKLYVKPTIEYLKNNK